MPELALLDERFEKPQQVPEATTLSPLQLLGTLRRNWPLILLFGLLFGAAAYVYTVVAVPKQFTTAGTLSIDMERYAIPALQGALSGTSMADPMPVVRSEVQVLTSRALLQQVADELHLVADPEFNALLRPRPFGEEVKRMLAGVLPLTIAQPLFEAGLLPDVTKADQPVPQAVVDDGIINNMMRNLNINNDNRSMIVSVQFTSLSPKTAAAVVNSLIKHYIESKSEGRASANTEANSELSRRVADARKEIDTLERKIADTRERYNLVQTRAGTVGQQQLEDLSSALTRASADRAQAVANYQRAAALARTGAVSTDNAAVLGSGTISALREREAAADRHVAQLATTLGTGHPQYRAAQAELASLRGALAAEAQRVMVSLGAQADAAKAREADLQRQLATSQKAAGGLATVQSELQQLERDADARRAVLQTLLQGEAQTASKTIGPEQSGVRLVSAAVPPVSPSSPKPKIAAVLGMMSGFAFGGLLSLAWGRRDSDLTRPEEMRKATGLAPLAVVPRPMGRVPLARRVVEDPSGPEAEALRALRMRLRFSGRGSAPRSVLFVSSAGTEGAAEVAAAFARVAAIDGVRILLLEGDLREPSLARILDVPPSNGMVETLQGREHWQEQVQQDTRTTLDHLLVAQAHPAASQLLDSMQLQNLVAEAKDEYNLIVMDSQPIGNATQTMVLANIVDTVVLVVGAKRAKQTVVCDAVRTLAAASRNPIVMALNLAA
jgi:succinoglycan biosynthesis transport protein ExoP